MDLQADLPRVPHITQVPAVEVQDKLVHLLLLHPLRVKEEMELMHFLPG
jgi:hypothetical protein